ncbi:MAG: hypothetical protein DI551_10510 [Micavibrio aeruginosavorus]|uniref:Lipoprotein n=1 Tax=Micavibrio aeruginosavorus TaxID=349221 RepID=A0A2W5MSN2_9BACT|nr:MAG: hypothetical protein DI551_10510 [Micavibrio aeruginosavorus]
MFMSHSTKILALSSAVLLSACGTIAGGQTQEITLATPGAYNAECNLNNGVAYKMVTGQKTTIMRSHKPLMVDCYAPGNRRKAVMVDTEIHDWAYADVTTGVVPGATFDHFAGGLYEYPEVITVDFVGVPTPGFELPDYHNKDVPNPYEQAIEDYGPNHPRIVSDSQYMPRGVTKREQILDSNPFAGARTATPTTPTPMPAAPATSSSAVPSGSLKGSSAEELNHSMNPTVFNR